MTLSPDSAPNIDTILPPHLAERATAVNAAPFGPSGPVIYWMRTAVRVHDNPALDAAMALADRLGRPMFIYHALSQRYPYASDRHHTFIMEGARDVATEAKKRGISYAFHLERPGHDGPVLHSLATHASAIITEDMPTAPMMAWTRRLAQRAPSPVIVVDAACILPMPLARPSPGHGSTRPFDRAFAFRKATARMRDERLLFPWNDQPVARLSSLPQDLPFSPVDIINADIPALAAACAIDHTIGPVADTPGGTVAGYRRWAAFRDERLRQYANRRNNALDRDGVSRMSAYLHYGQVSPFVLAREARAVGGASAEKFLDELLTWREMSYCFCRYTANHCSIDVLPDWARATLQEATGDPRPMLATTETLARSRTGDLLWDAAQTSLRVRGDLHNNLRMTWGKAVIGWTQDPETALKRIFDLNDRYALDGRDPNSVQGILWCLGQFDRPFEPHQPLLGAVRPRPTSQHAQRLDPAAFADSTGGPAGRRNAHIAVIGAGMAGATAARALMDNGHRVTVFDKGRGPGGRMSTRRTDAGAFDHGAQYFTARDPRFRRQVENWAEAGVVKRWNGAMVRATANGMQPLPDEDRFVGAPGMNAVIRHLCADLDVTFGVRIDALTRTPDGWELLSGAAGAARQHPGAQPVSDEPGMKTFGPFDAVIVAIPADQAEGLLTVAPALAEKARGVRMDPCWTVMFSHSESEFTQPDEQQRAAAIMFDIKQPHEPGSSDTGCADPEAGPLGWIARNDSKPGRHTPGMATWVLQATPAWSAHHIEDNADLVARTLLDAARPHIGLASGFPADTPLIGGESAPGWFVAAHRWRYARVALPAGEECLFDPEAGLGACGDWCIGARVEAAYLSGAAMAGRLMGWLSRP